jgi:selenium metabolism protein YedF
MVRFSGRRFLFLKIEGVNLMTTDNRHLATGTVLFLGSDIIGRGENLALGSLLMQSFLHTIGGLEDRPDTILLMNNGVKLVTQESPVLGELKQLESQGTEILACGTCLARFELTDKIAVGKVSNMYEITGKMLKADRVISL